MAAILLLAPLAHANITSQSASFDLNFVSSGASDVLLPGFNPALGTLNSVQLVLDFNLTSSTDANNQTFMIDPVGGVVFTPAQVDYIAVATVMLNADGFPVFQAGPSSGDMTTILAPLQDAPIQTLLPVAGAVSVPQPIVDSFVTTAFAPVRFSLMQDVIINAMGIGSTNGEVILGPTVSDFAGELSAFYDYTPAIDTPEPSSAALLALFIAILWIIRTKRPSVPTSPH
jgi:hypothetical protein